MTAARLNRTIRLLLAAIVAIAICQASPALAQENGKPIVLYVSNGHPVFDILPTDSITSVYGRERLSELLGSGATVVDVKVGTLEDIKHVVSRLMKSGEIPSGRKITGVVLNGHGDEKGFSLSKLVHHDGNSAAWSLANGLAGLPLEPRLGVYVWSCNCGADASSKGFSSQLAAALPKAFETAGIANEVTTVLANISLSNQERIEGPLTPFSHVKMDYAYGRLDTHLFRFVSRRLGPEAANRFSDRLPRILMGLAATAEVTVGILSGHPGVFITSLGVITPTVLAIQSSAKKSRQTLRILEVERGEIKVTVEHGESALPRTFRSACMAEL